MKNAFYFTDKKHMDLSDNPIPFSALLWFPLSLSYWKLWNQALLVVRRKVEKRSWDSCPHGSLRLTPPWKRAGPQQNGTGLYGFSYCASPLLRANVFLGAGGAEVGSRTTSSCSLKLCFHLSHPLILAYPADILCLIPLFWRRSIFPWPSVGPQV